MENAMSDALKVEETNKKTGVGKIEVSPRIGWDTIPETIRHLLSIPPLLPHENENAFMDLFESFRAYAEPESIVDYHLVFNATVSKWETVRYRFMATAVTANQQQAGLEALFMLTSGAASIPGAEKVVKV